MSNPNAQLWRQCIACRPLACYTFSRMRHELSEYGAGQRVKDVAAVGLFLWLCAMSGKRIYSDAETNEMPWIAVAVIFGLLAADFISGFVHWLGDTWGSIDMPVLGKAFIRPFREHHVDPKAITRHDFFETNGNNCFVSLPVVALTAFGPLPAGSAGTFTATFLVAMVIWVFLTNQIHKWSHMDAPPAWIAAMQRMRLILPPDHHQIHHTAPYHRYYCITNGWMNPVLEKIRFFPLLEKTISAATGLEPRAEDHKTTVLV